MRLIDAELLEEKTKLAINVMKLTAKLFGISDEEDTKALVEAYETFLDAVKDSPAVEADGWIPVEDRLPEENGEYLVTRESGFCRYMDIVRKSNCNSDLPMASDIIAWMPLPKPYQPKEEQV